jgi:SAM-dependent methyltransferase
MIGLLTAEEASLFQQEVCPRYLALFMELMVPMMLHGDQAKIAHCACRTGYPLDWFAEQINDLELVGIDDSAAAVACARQQADQWPLVNAKYFGSSQREEVQAAFVPGTFTHVVALHPWVPRPENRVALFRWAYDMLVPGGQLLFAYPLRSSFQEIFDLLREFALKHDALEVGKLAERSMSFRPTIELFAEEIESVGFTEVDVEQRPSALEFSSGHSFFRDPVASMIVIPDVAAHMGVTELGRELAYVQSAIDRYWSESAFDLTLSLGCASARRWLGIRVHDKSETDARKSSWHPFLVLRMGKVSFSWWIQKPT